VDAALLVVVVVLALAFAWSNGFHDASNAVATSLTTGALTPRIALGMAAALNAVGALLGVGLTGLFGASLIDLPLHRPGVGLVAAGLASALGWNVLTWWLGVPSSSSHALLGGLAGAGLAAGAGIDWGLLAVKVGLPMMVSPLVGFAGAWLVMLALLRVFRDAAYGPALRRFRLAQSVSAAAMAVGHGMQDGQRTMGMLLLALPGVVAAGPDAAAVPMWVRGSVAIALGIGTASGGWRVMRTLSRRLVPVEPTMGFAAQAVSAGVLYLATAVAAVPVSTTHTTTAAIMGAGSTAGLRAIRWGTVRRIAVAWLLTPLVTFLCGAGLLLLGRTLH
jgi:inorganic phosphate transporter, PiT family